MIRVVLLLLACASAPAQDPFQPLRFLAGEWEGAGKGQPGTSQAERRCQFVLKDKFLHCTGKSTYEKEVHQEWSFFSYDRGRKRLALRQFHIEGFVNQYVQEPDSLVFVTESIENIAPGWRARETYRVLSDDEFTETFELAAPGKDFELYTQNRFKRKK